MIRGANKLVEACKEKISENESELSMIKVVLGWKLNV